MTADMNNASFDRQYILSLESTCDETAAAIIRRDGVVLASTIATQELLHGRFGGVVPEIAARAHLENFLPVLRKTMHDANVTIEDMVAIAVATQPGLPGSLIVGLATAKGLCLAWDKPLVGVNHLHAHVYACQMQRRESIFPCIGLIVSGGHTHIYRCESAAQWKLLGATIDDAAGEAFDKVAAMLGLPFPGGPELAKLAESGDAAAHKFPRPMLKDAQTLDFSFSGLKTAVRYCIAGPQSSTIDSSHLSTEEVANLAASFEQAVIDCVVGKCKLAMKRERLSRLCVGGGVAANRRLRAALQELADRQKFELLLADRELCTDNAIMGAIAWEKIKAGSFDDLSLDVKPGLVRG